MQGQTNLPAIADRDARRIERTTLFRAAKVRPAVLAWALGVPIPIILIVLLIRGCM